MNKANLNIKSLQEQSLTKLESARRYSLIIFVVFVGVLYGFLLLRITMLGNTQPSPEAVSSQVKAAQVPHIDESVVEQLESLEDNSVSVKALFNQARNNPFQ